MQINVQKIDWDSIFFGIPIGKIDIGDSVLDTMLLQKINKSPFSLIYLFSNTPIQHYVSGLELVDIKAIFEKPISALQSLGEIKPVYFVKHNDSYEDIINLAYLSGQYSRFKLDNKLPAQSFERLYKKWVDKSIEDEDISIIVKKSIHNKITGFVTLENAQGNNCKIGLIAVYPQHQGEGIGSQLLTNAEIEGYNKGKTKIAVATQKANTGAMKLYQKNGYELAKLTHIYHYWKP